MIMRISCISKITYVKNCFTKGNPDGLKDCDFLLKSLLLVFFDTWNAYLYLLYYFHNHRCSVLLISGVILCHEGPGIVAFFIGVLKSASGHLYNNFIFPVYGTSCSAEKKVEGAIFIRFWLGQLERRSTDYYVRYRQAFLSIIGFTTIG